MIENNGEITIFTTDVTGRTGICVSCIICGESIELTMIEEMESRHGNIFKVCDECKKAVMKMRELTHQHEDK